MINNKTGILSSCRFGIILSGFLLMSLFSSSSAHAGFDRVFFFINGDSTISTMTQGDQLIFGSTSAIGGTINWEVWYDANGNSIIDPAADVLVGVINVTDGNPLSEVFPILDGIAMGPPMSLSLEPGAYILRAKDIATNATLQGVVTMSAMISPPNQLKGRILVPGITAPSSILANRSIFAESETGNEGIFGAITDINGMFSMNVGAVGSGVQFFLGTDNIPGFSTPPQLSAFASGIVTNNDFTYSVAVDSVWGFVKDDLGANVNYKGEVFVNNPSIGFSEKLTTTENGRYVIYFSFSDKGSWELEATNDYIPTYLIPVRFPFSHDTVGSFQHDITLKRTDTKIYARIMENGGLPVNNYLIRGFSQSLLSSTEALAGTGANNIATLSVSSMDLTGWNISINQYDQDFPFPVGFILDIGSVSNAAPGDTVTLSVKTGNLVSGTITQDPGDGPIVWSDVTVNASKTNGVGNFFTNVGLGGAYSLYTDTGTINMGVFASGYITNPATVSIAVTGATFGPGFVINKAHARVSGTLTNVTLPLNNSFYYVTAQTGTNSSNGYDVSAKVDSTTGTYTMNLSDGNWTITPPNGLSGVSAPVPAVVIIGEIPDTVKTVDFAYTGFSCCVGITGNIDCDPSSLVDITDLTVLIDHLFINLKPLCCKTAGNVDGDVAGIVDITDLTFLIDHLFISLVPTSACQ